VCAGGLPPAGRAGQVGRRRAGRGRRGRRRRAAPCPAALPGRMLGREGCVRPAMRAQAPPLHGAIGVGVVSPLVKGGAPAQCPTGESASVKAAAAGGDMLGSQSNTACKAAGLRHSLDGARVQAPGRAVGAPAARRRRRRTCRRRPRAPPRCWPRCRRNCWRARRSARARTRARCAASRRTRVTRPVAGSTRPRCGAPCTTTPTSAFCRRVPTPPYPTTL